MKPIVLIVEQFEFWQFQAKNVIFFKNMDPQNIHHFANHVKNRKYSWLLAKSKEALKRSETFSFL